MCSELFDILTLYRYLFQYKSGILVIADAHLFFYLFLNYIVTLSRQTLNTE